MVIRVIVYSEGNLFFYVIVGIHLKETQKRNTAYLSIFSPNVGKYGTEKLQIQTLFLFLLKKSLMENFIFCAVGDILTEMYFLYKHG